MYVNALPILQKPNGLTKNIQLLWHVGAIMAESIKCMALKHVQQSLCVALNTRHLKKLID